MPTKAMSNTPKSSKTDTRPKLGQPGSPSDDPTLVWSYGPPKKDDCSCKIITNTTILTRLFRRVRPPRGLVATPTSLTGVSSDAAWNRSVRVVRPAPCEFHVILPGRGAPGFVARARADNGAINGVRFRTADSIVSLTVRGSYHIQPKPGTAGALRATYSGSIAGTQTVAGRLGSGVARVEGKFFVPPFDRRFRRVRNAAAGAGGRIRGRFGIRAGTVGGAFVTNFGPIAATVPCCIPQNFTLVFDVGASRNRFVDAEARLDRASFTITAPDPPARTQVEIHSIEVSESTEPTYPDPTPGSGYRVRPLKALQRSESATSLTLAGNRLVLSLLPDPDKGSEIVQLSLGSWRVLRRTKTASAVSRLKTIPASSSSSDPTVIALAYDPPKRGAAAGPRQERGRIVRIQKGGRMTPLSGRTDLPIDLERFGDAGILLADLLGNLLQVGPRGRRRIAVEGLNMPLAIAVPPRGSAWRGNAYVAEGGDTMGDGQQPFGRIRELYFESCLSRTVLDQVDVTALAFAEGGLFKNDLLIATANEMDRSCDTDIPGTGQILRLSPEGALEIVVAGIDNPSAITLDSKRCFVLCSAGVFEIKRR